MIVITDKLRRFRVFSSGTVDEKYGQVHKSDIREENPEGNLYCSKFSEQSEMHWAMFDVDIAAQLVPSETPDHYHLYFNELLTWKQYRKVMKAMAKVGLVDEDWVSSMEGRKATYLRVMK